jgi:hypothetical protein
MNEDSRLNEWFVPKFGSLRFRVFIGLLFLPYTGMCISFTIMGSMLSASIMWDRVVAITIIYGLALGISAHAADGLGSKKVKPWGSYFTTNQLWLLLIISLAGAYSVGIYYIVFYVPMLSILAVLEGFFVFAYNFELFKGTFHNDLVFVISWGSLPLLAGYVMQTNQIGTLALAISGIAAIVSYVHIRLSRPYKTLKRTGGNESKVRRLESYLKIISLGTISTGLFAVLFRLLI